MIVIVDYRMGNLGSIVNMLKKIGVESKVSCDINEINMAKKIILPGVGNFDMAISNIEHLRLSEVLNKKALIDKIPILGICLGMQLLSEKSEEGNLKGLGWIKGEVKRFSFEKDNTDIKVPHMGWNTVTVQKKSFLFSDMFNDPRFYFVHSYYFKCNDKDDILTITNYGNDFTSAVQHDNIMGVQFHPEKSHKFGMMILKNFAQFNN